jgi:hypothetical protein
LKRSQRQALVAVLFAAVAALAAIAAATAGAQGPSLNAADMAGVVWDRGQAVAAAHANAHKSGKLLSYHGGPVQTSTTQVFPIFWGTSWSTSNAKVTGIDGFYKGVGGSSYAGTNTEYTNGLGQFVSSGVHENGVIVDNSAAPSHTPQTSEILAEVARKYPTPTPGAYYPVYIDQPRGSAGYCAWHSSGTIGTTEVQFAFFFNLDGDSGCDPQNPWMANQGLAALGNVSGHELSEMLTDPQLNAWYDQQGAENADKCAWTFSGNPITLGGGGVQWKIQGNWSNAAYNSFGGYIRGCIDGT